MALSRLIINDFRNLQAVDIQPNSGFNFIIGNNGSGKTSLLEAIYYLGHGRSFKSAVSQRIIHYQQPHFTLHARIHEQQHDWSVGLQKTRQGNSIVKINGEDGNKIAHLAQLLPMQIISPEGLTLLNGGPAFRRAFLDWGLFHHHPEFYAIWAKLRRLLKQRNAALQQTHSYASLTIWDKELSLLAHQVSDWRYKYANTLRPSIEQSCALFLPELEIQLSFHQGWDKDQEYADLLAQNFERDKNIGYTVAGPQKADFRFKANGLPVDDVLSRGQLKLMMCALRLAQGEHLTQTQRRHCLFLLDDFASELDQTKRTLLAERLQNSGSQVFVTAITQEQLKQMPLANSTLFTLHDGKLTQISPC